MAIEPAIVVCAYKRPASLRRLLNSLQRAVYPHTNVPLVISIDKGPVDEVVAVAEKFDWSWGKKIIIHHQHHLGLKEHVLTCGALTSEYGAVIVLEDDLAVSPYFYGYALKALERYADDSVIAGISLYNYEVSESSFSPFRAVDDGSDVYFMQVASSWGQLWTRGQWTDFINWLKTNPELAVEPGIPAYLQSWGRNSWKKHFICYLIKNNKYFVFPRLSLSSNFEEPGTNSDSTGIFHVPLQVSPKTYVFKSLNESNSVYDAWFELLPHCFNRLNGQLAAYNYTADLHNTKRKEDVQTDYVLTSKPGQAPVFGFAAELVPCELNVTLGLPGQRIGLYKLSEVNFDEKTEQGKGPRLTEHQIGVSVVIPVLKLDAEDLKATLSSVTTQNAKKECVIVCHSSALSDIEQMIAVFSFRIKLIPAEGESGFESLLYAGLKAAGQQIVTWIRPGGLLATDALGKAISIFEAFRNINWIRGVDEPCTNEYECGQVNTRPYRLIKQEVYERLRKGTLDMSTELHFFRKSCFNTITAKAFTLTTLFFDMISNYSMHVAVMNVGSAKSGGAITINNAERDNLLRKYAHFRQRKQPVALLVNLIIKPRFIRNDSRQWYLTSLFNYPGVLRYDYRHHTFFEYKY